MTRQEFEKRVAAIAYPRKPEDHPLYETDQNIIDATLAVALEAARETRTICLASKQMIIAALAALRHDLNEGRSKP